MGLHRKLHLAHPPPPIQQFVWRVCNHYLQQPLPEKWLEANIILLFKKGGVRNPVNYRPIALLNSVYKIIATHANRELLAAAIGHCNGTQHRPASQRMRI